MSDSYGNIIPQRWVVPERATKFEQQVIVNWLALEVPGDKALRAKAEPLTHWRNREVFHFIHYEWPDWTAGIYAR
jgi:hypothetical protein